MPKADIRIDVGFSNHRKTSKLIARLGFSAPTHLIFLWIATASTRPKGVLTNMDEFDLALDARWPGDADEFCRILYDVGFLDQVDAGANVRRKVAQSEWQKGLCYVVHDWEEWQSYASHAPERSAQASEAARIRWEKAHSCAPHAKRNAHRMRTACSEHARSNAPSPTPTPTPTPNPPTPQPPTMAVAKDGKKYAVPVGVATPPELAGEVVASPPTVVTNLTEKLVMSLSAAERRRTHA